MSTSALGSIFDIESAHHSLPSPPAALKKPAVPLTAYELDQLEWGQKYSGPKSGTATPGTAGTQTPITPVTIEDGRSGSVEAGIANGEDGAISTVIQTWRNPAKNKWRVLTLCGMFFGMGMTDSAVGALIPYMEDDYNIGYAIVSLVFVANAAGFIAAAFFADMFLARLGRARALMATEAIIIVSAVMIACKPPFGVVIAAFFLAGFGYGVHLAMNNSWLTTLADSTVVLGAAHGSYGIGGTVGPIIATTMCSRGIIWARFYCVIVGIRVACFIFAGWTFWGIERESPTQLLSALEQTASRIEATDSGERTKVQLFKEALKSRVTLIGALFIFAYQGAEVATSGWVISFLINYRDGDPSKVGYVTAGFWAGITLGRFVLTHFAHRFGERNFVYALGVGSIIFQLLVWLVPNVVGDAVAVSILGLLLGPIYPCGQTIFSRLLPRRVHMTSIGFIASAGSSGGAVAPLLTGLLAQAVGTWVLHPVCVGLFAVMLLCWFGLPVVRKRTE